MKHEEYFNTREGRDFLTTVLPKILNKYRMKLVADHAIGVPLLSNKTADSETIQEYCRQLGIDLNEIEHDNESDNITLGEGSESGEEEASLIQSSRSVGRTSPEERSSIAPLVSPSVKLPQIDSGMLTRRQKAILDAKEQTEIDERAKSTSLSSVRASGKPVTRGSASTARKTPAAASSTGSKAVGKKKREKEHASKVKQVYRLTGDILGVSINREAHEYNMWAVNRLFQFASIAPGDPGKIALYILHSLPQEPCLPRLDIDASDNTLEASVARLDYAISAATGEEEHSLVQFYIRAMQVAICWKQTAQQQESGGEAYATKIVSDANAIYHKNLGVRVVNLAFAISPRALFGVLVLQHFGFLSPRRLEREAQGRILALINLLVASDRPGSINRADIPPMLADVVDCIVEQLLPAVECFFTKLVVRLHDHLPPYARDLIVLGDAGDDARFGLRMTRSRRGVGGLVVRLPPPQLIDGRYRSLGTEEQPEPMRFYENTVHLTYRNHFELMDRYPITPATVQSLQVYQSFWGIIPVEVNNPYRFPGQPLPPTPLIDESEWYSLDAGLRHWALSVNPGVNVNTQASDSTPRPDQNYTVEFYLDGTSICDALAALSLESPNKPAICTMEQWLSAFDIDPVGPVGADMEGQEAGPDETFDSPDAHNLTMQMPPEASDMITLQSPSTIPFWTYDMERDQEWSED